MGHRVSCPAACGTFPDQGSNQCPFHCKADSVPLDHQGSPIIEYRVGFPGLYSGFLLIYFIYSSICGEGKWQPTPARLPRKLHGRRSLAGYTAHGVAQRRTRLKQLSSSSVPLPLLPPANLSLFSTSATRFLLCNSFICTIFSSTYKQCHMIFAFF